MPRRCLNERRLRNWWEIAIPCPNHERIELVRMLAEFRQLWIFAISHLHAQRFVSHWKQEQQSEASDDHPPVAADHRGRNESAGGDQKYGRQTPQREVSLPRAWAGEKPGHDAAHVRNRQRPNGKLR